jgi:hypothetical protein
MHAENRFWIQVIPYPTPVTTVDETEYDSPRTLHPETHCETIRLEQVLDPDSPVSHPLNNNPGNRVSVKKKTKPKEMIRHTPKLYAENRFGIQVIPYPTPVTTTKRTQCDSKRDHTKR